MVPSSLARSTSLLGCLLGLTLATAFASQDGKAPLDTLVAETFAPVSTGHIVMTRSTLPDISTTSVPRRPPPAAPPRLDDPSTGERLFSTAAHAARLGQKERSETAIHAALAARPDDSRLPLWQVTEALRQRDPSAFIWHLPGAVRAVQDDPLAVPRLAVQGHQAALLVVALFWTLLVIAGLAAWWPSIAHDLTAMLFRDPRHRSRSWTPWLLVGVAILVRPGWLGILALLSLPLLLQVKSRVRALVIVTWLAALGLSFPNWPLLRDSMPMLDPDSETTMLVRAGRDDASPLLIQDLRERLALARDSERQQRLHLALGLQEARRGRYTASNELLQTVLKNRPHEVVALVGLANNSYYLSRFDEALLIYSQARKVAPQRGEIPFNMAQVYLKKLFLPEAGQALEEARALGFAPRGQVGEAEPKLDFSPTVYLGLSRKDLGASARFESDHYHPLVGIAGWKHFLGAPPLPLFLILAGVLTMALVLVYWGKLQDDVRHCGMCSSEICRHCCRIQDKEVICLACAETIERARSEMVLATLLKNHSRSVGLARTARLVRLARILPGTAHLALGDAGGAMRRLGLLAVALFMICFGWAFDPSSTWSSPGLALPEELLHSLWMPIPAAAWPGPWAWPVVAGLILLATGYLLAVIDASRLRQRLPERMIQMHVNPAPGPGRA